MLKIFIVSIVMMFLYPHMALSCACCANSNTNIERKVFNYEWDELRKLKLSGSIGLDYLGERDPSFSFGQYIAQANLAKDTIIINILDAATKIGSLNFKVLDDATIKRTDLWLILGEKVNAIKEDHVLLHSQITIKGEISSSKDLDENLENYEFSKIGKLILHGLGNNCLNAKEMHTWTFRTEVIFKNEKEPILGRGEFKP